MAKPLALPAMAAGIVAALIATANTPAVVPLGCVATWTKVGGTIIFKPDCTNVSPLLPNDPPPDNQPPPQPEPPPAS
jgi:hypothetical protein